MAAISKLLVTLFDGEILKNLSEIFFLVFRSSRKILAKPFDCCTTPRRYCKGKKNRKLCRHNIKRIYLRAQLTCFHARTILRMAVFRLTLHSVKFHKINDVLQNIIQVPMLFHGFTVLKFPQKMQSFGSWQNLEPIEKCTSPLKL